ncbi:MAG: 2-oxoglutarate dehydrogenase complex dihydrolipoyllysine-residue succinyltransferase [Bacteroidetes bacterium]|nr:2-oxoglutarate dehydrogenase complex dihydrolipoyllysine-residue succinyltransferase [Bacteroidota bacterium]
MAVEIKIPQIGESISEAILSSWLVSDGDYVEKDQEIAEIDSDKATIMLNTEQAGEVKLLVEEGAKVLIGDVVCSVDTSKEGKKKVEEVAESKVEATPEAEPPKQIAKKDDVVETANSADLKVSVSPIAGEMIEKNNLDINEVVKHKLLRITKSDVESFTANHTIQKEASREERTQEMSPLRKKLAERLVKSKNESAMLTTFNEVDMTEIIAARKKYGKDFLEKHGLKLGFMGFFAKAVSIALADFPEINARIENNNIVYHDYMDIGIAVSSPKGLMVPVIRNAETLSITQLEQSIFSLAEKARNKKLSLDEMTGGTFTITNGGVFGSLLSTPIINPPQVAILGMHKIQERPVGINGKIELRPMMNLAVSYDHRIVDGKESVSFLVSVIEMLENPAFLLSDGKNPAEVLLGL